MKTRLTITAVCLLVCVTVPNPLDRTTSAERVSKSDLSSALQPQCDLCWNPSPGEQNPERLPTFRSHRPPRLPDSRPHRLPKGRYELAPKQKHARLSALRARVREQMRLHGGLQVFVVDGDTIRVGADRIRLRGIDTPELNEPEGQAAKQRLEELLRSGPVRVVPRGRDVYDRLLADVFVNGQNVAEILKSEGFAKIE